MQEEKKNMHHFNCWRPMCREQEYKPCSKRVSISILWEDGKLIFKLPSILMFTHADAYRHTFTRAVATLQWLRENNNIHTFFFTRVCPSSLKQPTTSSNHKRNQTSDPHPSRAPLQNDIFTLWIVLDGYAVETSPLIWKPSLLWSIDVKIKDCP